jgi:hypothetical protein
MTGEKGEFIEIPVVYFCDNRTGCGLDLSKVHDHPTGIELLSAHHNLDLPVVPVERFTLTAEIPQIVRGGKISYDLEFVHLFLLRLPGVRLAAHFAATIRADYTYTGAITAQNSLGKIDGLFVLVGSSRHLLRLGLRGVAQLPAAPAAVPTSCGERALTGRTGFFPKNLSTVRTFPGHPVLLSSRKYYNLN